jgi:hypothetical protein
VCLQQPAQAQDAQQALGRDDRDLQKRRLAGVQLVPHVAPEQARPQTNNLEHLQSGSATHGHLRASAQRLPASELHTHHFGSDARRKHAVGGPHEGREGLAGVIVLECDDHTVDDDDRIGDVQEVAMVDSVEDGAPQWILRHRAFGVQGFQAENPFL